MYTFNSAMLALAFGSAALSFPAVAADHQVQMLNKGPDGETMAFDPAFLRIQPGDTVTFLPTDNGHNSESIKGMIPEGAESWKGKINQEITVTFAQEGVYGYKCLPHFGMGMIGLIHVGENAANLGEAQSAKLPNKAAERFEPLFVQAETDAAAAPPQ